MPEFLIEREIPRDRRVERGMEPGGAFFREAGRGAAVVCIHSSASS